MQDSLIDIHAHILPGIDDGARTIEESIEMAAMAVSQGIKTIIATPHYYRRGSGKDKDVYPQREGIILWKKGCRSGGLQDKRSSPGAAGRRAEDKGRSAPWIAAM